LLHLFSIGIDCHLSFICNPLRCLGTPSPSLVAVTPPGHRNCVVRGWHFESCLSRFSTHPILPLVDCGVSSLGALPGFHLPTNRDRFINAALPTQLPPSSKTNAICVGLTSVHRRSLPSQSPSLAIYSIVGPSLLSMTSPNVVGIYNNASTPLVSSGTLLSR
jgi:hypothetical protein